MCRLDKGQSLLSMVGFSGEQGEDAEASEGQPLNDASELLALSSDGELNEELLSLDNELFDGADDINDADDLSDLVDNATDDDTEGTLE